MMGGSVRKIAMAVRRSSVLRGWSVGTFLLLGWGRCVEIVPWVTQETHSSVTVYNDSQYSLDY